MKSMVAVVDAMMMMIVYNNNMDINLPRKKQNIQKKLSN